jgi:hypothetical protein
MNWYKKSQTAGGVINQQKEKRESLIDGRPVYLVDGQEYMQPRQDLGDPLWSIPVSLIEKGWKGDRGFYLGTENQGILGRKDRFIEFLNNDIPVETPIIHVDENGKISFTNGRHRYSVLRDMGRNNIAFTLSESANFTYLLQNGAVRLK